MQCSKKIKLSLMVVLLDLHLDIWIGNQNLLPFRNFIIRYRNWCRLILQLMELLTVLIWMRPKERLSRLLNSGVSPGDQPSRHLIQRCFASFYGHFYLFMLNIKCTPSLDFGDKVFTDFSAFTVKTPSRFKNIYLTFKMFFLNFLKHFPFFASI